MMKKNKGQVEYIASPYSSHDADLVELNYKLVTAFVSDRVSKGHVALSPITYGHTLLSWVDMPGDWEFWKNFCISLLDKCDKMIVLKMDGWDKSLGVAAEIEHCEKHGIPVEYVEPHWIEVTNDPTDFSVINEYDDVWVKFDDGQIMRFSEEDHPFACVTHFMPFSMGYDQD